MPTIPHRVNSCPIRGRSVWAFGALGIVKTSRKSEHAQYYASRLPLPPYPLLRPVARHLPSTYPHSMPFSMPSSGSPSLPESQGTRRNIQRIASACDYCRSRKVRCDGHNPCSGCQRGGQQCVFRDRRQRKPRAAQSLRAGAPQSLNDPVHYKKQLELRAGFGVSNAATGCFQFYGTVVHTTMREMC